MTLDELRADVDEARSTPSSSRSPTCRVGCWESACTRDFFLEESLEHGIEGCNYLLALEMEMDPVPGLRDRELGARVRRLRMVPDLATLRRIPWLDGTALVLCDVGLARRRAGRPSPRQVLRAQVERGGGAGFRPMFGSELEFYLFKDSYDRRARSTTAS